MEDAAPAGGQQPIGVAPPTPTPVMTPEFVLAATPSSDSPTTELAQPGFATVTPTIQADSASVPVTETDKSEQVAISSTATSAPEILATATNAPEILATPTLALEILATPTPLGAGELISKETTTNIWKTIRQALWFAVVAIGFLLLAFLAYRVIMGARKQK